MQLGASFQNRQLVLHFLTPGNSAVGLYARALTSQAATAATCASAAPAAGRHQAGCAAGCAPRRARNGLACTSTQGCPRPCLPPRSSPRALASIHQPGLTPLTTGDCKAEQACSCNSAAAPTLQWRLERCTAEASAQATGLDAASPMAARAEPARPAGAATRARGVCRSPKCPVLDTAAPLRCNCHRDHVSDTTQCIDVLDKLHSGRMQRSAAGFNGALNVLS